MSNPARTGTQKALHVVSIIMIVLGVLVILSGASLIALGVSAATMGMAQPMTLGDTETTADTTSVALGIIVLAMGLVQLVVAAFGLRGSKDASKIGPFRILIWGISLVILATILYGWFFNGNWYIQNSPLLQRDLPAGVLHPRRRGEEGARPGHRGRGQGRSRALGQPEGAAGHRRLHVAGLRHHAPEPRHRGVSASFHSSVKAVDPSTAFTISHQISSPG